MKAYSMRCCVAALFALACILSGCGHFDQAVYDQAFTALEKSAVKYNEQDKHVEVIYITRALLDAEPDNQKVLILQNEALAAEPNAAILVKKSVFGANMTDHVAVEGFPLWGRLLLYIPNRALDLLDVITLEAGLCFGIGAKVQATDFVSLGAQVSGGETVIGLNRRHLSVRATVEEYVHVLPSGAGFLGEARAYTGGSYGLASSQSGIKSPTDNIYQRARDFFAVGAQAEAVSLAATAKLHPVEIFDFRCGFALYDLLED